MSEDQTPSAAPPAPSAAPPAPSVAALSPMPWNREPPEDDEPPPWEPGPPDDDDVPPDDRDADDGVAPDDPDAEFWAAERAAGAGPQRPAGWTGEGEVWAAGFLHRDRVDGVPRGEGFASGGPLDEMEAGALLALAADAATRAGHDRLGESELIGVLCGWRKIASWAAAGQAAAVITLARRRAAQARERDNPHLAEHTGDEIAAALTLTGHAARLLLADAAGLARLPAVHQSLRTGAIDAAKAAVLTGELAVLPADHDAAVIADKVLPDAPGLTTGQLRHRLRALILAADPDADRRRAAKARTDTDVVLWPEPSGNACLAGRELPEADALAAQRRVAALARWLHDRGAPGSLGQLRGAVLLVLLTGRAVQSLLPAHATATAGPGDPVGAPAPPVSGAIALTLPLSAWAGLSQTAGEVAGYGPVPAATGRDLAGLLAESTAARWQLILTGPAGQPLATAALGSGHGPPRGPAAIGWATTALDRLTRVGRLDWLDAGPCGHRRAEDRYQPSARLRNLITCRNQTCAAPGCRRPAVTCDLDHTVPYHMGGITCECNLSPLCRRHHRAKQVWHLEQTRPGVLTWTTPSGRTYTTTPDPYPV
jgi:hypothetical protein